MIGLWFFLFEFYWFVENKVNFRYKYIRICIFVCFLVLKFFIVVIDNFIFGKYGL